MPSVAVVPPPAAPALPSVLPGGEQAGGWSCHNYEGDKRQEWCRTVGSEGGKDYQYFPYGIGSPCAGCWCCERPRVGLPELVGASAAGKLRLYAGPQDAHGRTPLPFSGGRRAAVLLAGAGFVALSAAYLVFSRRARSRRGGTHVYQPMEESAQLLLPGSAVEAGHASAAVSAAPGV